MFNALSAGVIDGHADASSDRQKKGRIAAALR
jgi:hypothetical protein